MADTVNPSPPNRTAQETSVSQRIGRHIQGRTVNGLMELFPLLVTIAVMAVIIGYADGFVHPLIKYVPWDIPFIGGLAFTGVGLIVLGLVFYLTGLVSASHLGRRFFDLTGKVLNRTPLVGTIYGLTQTVAGVMSSQYRFSRVVFLEWPREGMIAMGFVTGRAVSPRTHQSMAIVYIPTVPNPTSGNMAIVNEDDVFETDMTVEDAMKMVFSGGIVLPESMAFARVPREPEPNEFLDRFEAIGD